jgi:phage N-6-adenine-methyltransferase
VRPIIVDPEFAALIPPHDNPAALEEDLVAHGCRDPLLVWKEEGILLDGHTRKSICDRLGIAYRVTEESHPDRLSARIRILRIQLTRRNLPQVDRLDLADLLRDAVAELGKERQRAGQVKGGEVHLLGGNVAPKQPPPPKTREVIAAAAGRGHPKLRAMLPQAISVEPHDGDLVPAPGGSRSLVCPPPKTREVIAAAAGVGARTVDKYHALKVAGKLTPEVKRAMREGETSIHAEHKKLTVHVTHATGDNEWYTPESILDLAREVMGGIDLDPASCSIANERVKATKIHTLEDSGLDHEWHGRVWMNPPYAAGLIDKFAAKLRAEVEAGRVKQAIVLVNNATETAWFSDLVEVCRAWCVPRGRIRFIGPNGEKGAPLQGQAILYMGNLDFLSRFSSLGSTWVRHG